MIVPARRLVGWAVGLALAPVAAAWGLLKTAEQRRHVEFAKKVNATQNLAVLSRNEGLPVEVFDDWFEECPDCEATGMADDSICGRCEGRCYVAHVDNCA